MATDPARSAPRRAQRAVLFADLADSSRLYRELGDSQGRAVILAALAAGRQAVEEHGGRVLEVIGDELFCLFEDGRGALDGAGALQQLIQSRRLAGSLPRFVAFRVGLAAGPVELNEDGSIHGDTVYLAKRVSTAAKAEQVLTTRATLDELGPSAVRARTLDVIRLKGRVDEVTLVEFLWSAESTVPAQSLPGAAPAPAAPPGPGRLVLEHDGRRHTVDARRPSLTLGRGDTCDLVVADTRVSRLHARVDLRRDGFVLVDLSRNGCRLSSEGNAPREVLRSEAPLGPAGEVQLGPDDDAPRVRFQVDGSEPR